jgi:hypothetical protein
MRHIGLLLPVAIAYVLIPMTAPMALNANVPPCSNAEVLSNLSDVIWKNSTQMELLAKIGLPREQVAKFSFTDIRPTPLYQDSSIRTCEATFHVDLDLDLIEKKLGAMAATVAMMLGASLAAMEKVRPTIGYTIQNTGNGGIDVKWVK